MKENIVKIGSKDFTTYVKTIDFLINKKNSKKVVIVARGKRIKDAVDLFEVSKQRGYEIKSSKIKTSTEHFQDNGKDLVTSSIEITMEIR